MPTIVSAMAGLACHPNERSIVASVATERDLNAGLYNRRTDPFERVRVPVIDDDGRPIGIVSMNDLARLAVRSKRSGVDRELVRTLAAVCQPRQHVEPTVEVQPSASVLVV